MGDGVARSLAIREKHRPAAWVRVLLAQRMGEVLPAQPDDDAGLRPAGCEDLRGPEERVLLLGMLEDEDTPLGRVRDDAIADAGRLRSMAGFTRRGRHGLTTLEHSG